jgi:HAMP domain-containing protein
MSQTFVVEVTEKPDATPEESIESLARAFNISSRKIELMLRRLPGVATKPISEQEASVVVTYFEQAGLKAIVKSVTMPSSAGASTSTAPAAIRPQDKPVKASEQISDSARGSSDIAKARLASVTAPEQTAGNKSPAVPPEPVLASRSSLTSATTPSQPASPAYAASPAQTVSPVQTANQAQAATQTLIPPPTAVEIPVVTPVLQPLDVAELLRSSSQPAPVAPPKETRSEHDILRNTLIGEPDPRKTQIGSRTLSDVYKTSSLPKTTTSQNKLGNRLLLSAILPTLLTLLGSLAVTYLMVQPALSEHLQNSSRNPAVAVASGLASVMTTTPSGAVDYASLQTSINATRAAFDGQDLHFIVVTDSRGEILPASWLASSSFASGPDLRQTIQAQATKAMTDATLASSFTPLGSQGLLGSNRLEIVSQPLRLDGETVGAVVVGITGNTVQTNIWRVLGSVALLSLVPLALASLLAILAIRPITRRVAYLTQRANDISRGNLGESVEMTGNDELSQLGEALERLRVSMQSALDRLRRRR